MEARSAHLDLYLWPHVYIAPSSTRSIFPEFPSPPSDISPLCSQWYSLLLVLCLSALWQSYKLSCYCCAAGYFQYPHTDLQFIFQWLPLYFFRDLRWSHSVSISSVIHFFFLARGLPSKFDASSDKVPLKISTRSSGVRSWSLSMASKGANAWNVERMLGSLNIGGDLCTAA